MVGQKNYFNRAISQELRIGDNATYLHALYLDGIPREYLISYDLRGELEIARVKTTKEAKIGKKFRILCPKTGKSFFISEKAKGRDYLRAMQENEIHFFDIVSQTKLEAAIEKTFLPMLKKCTNYLEIPYLNGWNDGIYQDKRHWQDLLKEGGFEELPILEKQLSEATEDSATNFLKNLLKFSGVKEQLYLLIALFGGALASLLEMLKITPDKAILVIMNDVHGEHAFSKMVQTFCERETSPIDASMNGKLLEKEVAKVRDECRIFDARQDGTDYKQKKSLNNASWIVTILNRERVLSNPYCRYVDASGIILIKEFIQASAPEIVFEKIPDISDNRTFGSEVSALFIKYVEENLIKVKASLQNVHEQFLEQYGARIAANIAVLEVVSTFFGEYRIAFWKSLQLRDAEEAASVLACNGFGGNLVENFRRMILTEIKHCFIIPHPVQRNVKLEQNQIQRVCYINGDGFWIPNLLLDRWLRKNHMLNARKEILALLKAKGVIQTDDSGFLRHLGVRYDVFDCLQIQIEFFDRLGQISVLDMGKEVQYVS